MEPHIPDFNGLPQHLHMRVVAALLQAGFYSGLCIAVSGHRQPALQ